MKNIMSQSLGLDIVNINAYAKFYQNILLSSRDRAIFTLSEFEPRQRLGQSQKTFDNLLGYILSISMRMQTLSKYSKRFKSYRHCTTLRKSVESWISRSASNIWFCHILSKYSKRFDRYRHFSRTGRRQNLHKLSGDKIKCLVIRYS